jgi:hypothetical protein
MHRTPSLSRHPPSAAAHEQIYLKKNTEEIIHCITLFKSEKRNF